MTCPYWRKRGRFYVDVFPGVIPLPEADLATERASSSSARPNSYTRKEEEHQPATATIAGLSSDAIPIDKPPGNLSKASASILCSSHGNSPSKSTNAKPCESRRKSCPAACGKEQL